MADASQLFAKVLTVSDGVSAGVRKDKSGVALAERLTEAGYEIADQQIVADGIQEVGEAIVEMAHEFSGLIVTTGGTGFGPRDLTPEGTGFILDRHAPGLAEAMRGADKLGRLSRGLAGTRGEALILNTPGSTKGALANLEAVIDVLDHAVRLLAGDDTNHPHHA